MGWFDSHAWQQRTEQRWSRQASSRLSSVLLEDLLERKSQDFLNHPDHQVALEVSDPALQQAVQGTRWLWSPASSQPTVLLPDACHTSAPKAFDAAVSSLEAHAHPDIIGWMRAWHIRLKPGASMLVYALGDQTLEPLRHAYLAAEQALAVGHALRVMPMIALKDWGMLAQQSGFQGSVADVSRWQVSYPSLMACYRDFEALNLRNTLSERYPSSLTRGLIGYAENWLREHYPNPSRPGSFLIPYSVISLSMHASADPRGIALD